MHRLLPLVVALLLVSGCTREAVAPQSALPSAPTHTDPGVRVYVTNESSGDLTVIDAVTQMVIATVPVGKRPRGIKVSPIGSRCMSPSAVRQSPGQALTANRCRRPT
jgi:YVTN family beta-propeller protein